MGFLTLIKIMTSHFKNKNILMASKKGLAIYRSKTNKSEAEQQHHERSSGNRHAERDAQKRKPRACGDIHAKVLLEEPYTECV